MGSCKYGDPDRYYQYFCEVHSFAIGDLRYLHDGETESDNLDITIVITVMSMVCIIGVIVGYLIHRKGRKQTLMIGILFICVTLASAEENEKIVPYRRVTPHRVEQTVELTFFACPHDECNQNCHLLKRKQMHHFEICSEAENNPGTYLIDHCMAVNRVLTQTWDNPQCDGEPLLSEIMFNCNEIKPGMFYSLKCSNVRSEPDLRLPMDSVSKNVYMNISVTLLSIVCIIGIIVGYLMHRRRKKSAEVPLLMMICL